jgi:Pyridoxamine 5'-phosphate oxidase
MGQFFDAVPPSLIPWAEEQKVFWVATAPLAEDGHVNVSPKGCFEKTLNIVRDEESDEDPKKRTSRAVWYEDLTGSGMCSSARQNERLYMSAGVETIAHLRENGRITIMLTAFEGPPRIVRFFGTGKPFSALYRRASQQRLLAGKVFEFGTPEYDALLPPSRRQPGSRAVIWVDVHKVGSVRSESLLPYPN